MSKVAVRTPALVAFALLIPLAAAAQSAGGDVRRPYRALFGGDPNDATASSLTVNFDGGYEKNVLPKDTAQLDPRFQSSTLTGGLAASFILQRSGERASYGLSVSSSLRYMEVDDELTSAGHGARTFGRFALGPRASMSVNGGFMWAPLYNPLLSGSGFGSGGFSPFSPTRVGANYAAGARPAVFAMAGVTMDYAVTRRASVSGGYAVHYEDYTDEDQQQRADSFQVGSGYRLTRYSSLRASYRRSAHRLTHGGSDGQIDDFSLGVDYSRPLSLSGRRTTFTVTPGWALDRRGDGVRLQITGSATLDHEIGRTWTARAAYHRGFRFADGLDAEMLANTATGYVQGLINRRLTMMAGGQLVISDHNHGEASRDYYAYSLSSQFSFALSRNISTYAQYIYYSYRFGDSIVLPAPVAQRLDRQGIRVGLSFWVPVQR